LAAAFLAKPHTAMAAGDFFVQPRISQEAADKNAQYHHGE
jgi:hypothetical protein